MTLFLTISGRCSPPSGTRRRGRTYRGLRFAHPRLSMVGPLRGPSANEDRAGFCGGLSCWPAPRTLCKRKSGKHFTPVSHAGLLRGPSAGGNRQAFCSGFSCWPALRTLCKRKSGKHFAAISHVGLLRGPFANENRASFLWRLLMLACSADPLRTKTVQAFCSGLS